MATAVVLCARPRFFSTASRGLSAVGVPLLGSPRVAATPSSCHQSRRINLNVGVTQPLFGRGTRSFASAVPASLVKELRERTGASMGKCNTALKEEGGDLDRAVAWLRQRGIKSAEKRVADAGEALLALGLLPSAGGIAELRAETDFVTRSELFQQLAVSVALTAAQKDHLSLTPSELTEAVSEAALQRVEGFTRISDGLPVKTALLELSGILGERIVLGECQSLVAPAGSVVEGYIHPKGQDAAFPGTGRLAALVAVRASPEGAGDQERLRAIAKKLARHIVAAQPQFVSVDSIPVDAIEKEREATRAAFIQERGEKAAANEEVLKKVIDGKMQKFYQESVLLRQELLTPGVDPMPVSSFLEAEAKSVGIEAVIVDGFRVAVL